MTPRRWLVTKIRFNWIPLALIAVLTTSVATADTLLVERTQRAQEQAVPRKGATMVEVESQYGAPQQKRDAVGQPPISRWVYPAFTVYFERDYVINAVVNKASPTEQGPRPALAGHPQE